MANFRYILIVSILIGCSSIQFKSSDINGVTFDTNGNTNEKVSVSVEKEFYLWGVVPHEQIVDVDKLFENNGYHDVSSLEIKEINTHKKAMWMLLTFGVFYPQTFELSGRVRL